MKSTWGFSLPVEQIFEMLFIINPKSLKFDFIKSKLMFIIGSPQSNVWNNLLHFLDILQNWPGFQLYRSNVWG